MTKLYAAHGCVGAALLTLAALTFVPPAQAQTSVVLLSNINQANFRRGAIELDMDTAQMFTTGVEATGYKLTSVDLSIRSAANCPHTVSVYRANSIFRPSGLVASLSRGVTGNNEANYTASGDGIDLIRSTRYSIVVDSTTNCTTAEVNTTIPDDVDEAAPGWTIRSQGHQRVWDKTGTNDWGTTNSDNALRIAIHGHVIVANTAPTAAAGAVTTLEDTAYAFAAADFNFSDTDTGDMLADVNIVTLPSKGTLALSGTAVTAGDLIERNDDLDAGNLTYTPQANDHGDAFASFTFKVSDGTAESAGGAVMTINVTKVNDVPTGAPAIVGAPVVGATLTLDLSGIMDADGLPAASSFTINWYHTDDTTTSVGSTASYALTMSDVGKKLRVVVGFTDDDGTAEEVVLASWPENGNIIPVMTLSVAPATIYEDGRMATVTLATADTSAVTADVPVALTLAGTATKGTDYSIASESLTLATGDSSVTTTITSITDDTTEGDETVLVSAASGSVTIGSAQTVTVRDPPALTVEVVRPAAPRAVEGSSVAVPVELSAAPGREVTITITATPATGASPSDYTVSPLALTFGPSETRKEVTVTATDDTDPDPHETVRIAIDAASLPAGITVAGSFQAIAIKDNDFDYNASLVGGTALAVDEAAGTLTATVRVQSPDNFQLIDLEPLNETVTLTASTADGTATAGEDYTALSTTTLTFAYSDFSEIANCVGNLPCVRAEMTVTVPITDDMVSEGTAPETFTLTLSHGSGQRVAYPSGATATVSITDNDVPALTLSALPPSILEGGGMATVTVSTGAGPTFSSDQTITLSLAGTATKGTDYSIASESLTLTAGETSATTTITATADMVSDGDETILISATHNMVTIGTQQTVTITEAAPTLSVAVSQASIAEAAGSSTLTVSSTSAFSTDQTISLALAGTATKGDDYTISPESLTLTAGEISVTATVTAVQDTIDDDDETVLITATHNTVTIGTQQTVTITDDDAAPTLSVAVNQASIAEAAGSSTFTVSTGGTTFASDQTIALTLAGTATKTADYTISAESLTLTAGQASVMATVTAVQDIIDEPNETVLITASRNSVTIGAQQTVTITDDDDAPTLSVAVSADTIAEAAGNSTLTVSTGGTTFASDQTIALTLAGTATKGDDYTINSESLTLPAGADSVTATVTAVQDTIDDDAETVLITATHNSDTIGAQQTVTITDDDAAPTLSVAVNPAAIAEAAGSSTLTVSTGGTTFASDQTIALALAGTATKGDDYTISSESLTLAAGAGSVTATVTAVQDTFDEPNETVLITASRNSVTIGTQQTVTITDDDAAPTLSVAVSPDTIAEAAGASTVTVSSTSTFASDQTIALTLAGTATKGDDYTISAESLTLTAGQTSVTATVTAVQDVIDEPDETVLITATHNSVAIGTQQTVTITDDDAPTLSLAVGPTTIDEAAGASTVTVSSTSTFSSDQTIALTLAGTATKGDDYTISAESLTLTAGQTSVSATITAVADMASDDNETILITATHNSVTIGTQQMVTITETLPTLSISLSADTIAEAAGASTLTVSSTSTFAGDQTISLALAGTATQTADYTISSESLTLTAGETSVTATVTAVQDIIDEVDETVLITATHNSVPIGTQQTVTITDDDAPTLSVAVSADTIAEAAGASTVTVSTGGTTFSTDQVITLTLAGTATKGDDYTISAESLTLTAGQTSVTATVTAVQDTIDDDDETVLITATHNMVTIGTQQTITITDDDEPMLSVAVSAAAIAEAAGASTVTVSTGGSTFTTDQVITLTLAGTATKTADYTISSESLTLTAGETSVTATVTAVQDTIDDDAETVLITATHNMVTIGTQQTVTITDDDDAPTLSVAVSPAAIAEAAGASTVTVSTGGTTFTTDQVIALTLAGTATQTADYTISAQSLTLTAGETSVTATVTAVQDTIDDDAETVIVTAGNGGNTIGSATVTITDDDAAPTLSVAVSPAAIAEAAGASTVTVSTGTGSTFASDQTIALTLAGTATQTADYTISAQSLTLTAGQTSVTATVTAVQDTIDDDAETVIVTAGNGGNTIGSATVTITDDDAAPTLSVAVSPAAIAEAAGASTVTVSTGTGSTFATDQAITLTLGGTATEGGDFGIGPKSLTLAAGTGTSASSVSTTITAVQDKIDESNETILIDATRATGGSTVAVGSQLTVTITDDDAVPVLEFTLSSGSVAEAAGASTVTVGTGTGSTFETEQTITLTLGGTATEGGDFGIGPKSLTLAAGTGTSASSVSTTITAVQDKIDESNETILIDATRATGGSTVAVGSQLTVTITDDDAVPVLEFTLSSGSVAEASGTSTVMVGTGTGSTFETEQTITLTLGGTATENDDYTIGSKSLLLPAGAGTGASSVETVITAVQDTIDEPDETALITATHSSATIGTPQTVTIADDDAAPVLSLSVTSTAISEAAGTSTVTVGTGTGSTFETDQAITLTLGGTATVNDDYTIGSTTLTLPAGAGSAVSEITTEITAVDDDFFEGVTQEQLTVAGSRGGTDFGATRTVTILENEDAPKLTLSLSDNSISENGGSTTVTASVAPRTVDAFTVTFAVTPGAPATAADYDLAGTLSFAALSASPTGTVTITTNNNRVDRPDKTVSVTGTSSQTYFRATDAVTLTIEDEDAAPAPVLEVSAASIAENGGESTVTVTTSDGSTFPDAMTVTLTMTGAAGENADYTIGSKSLTLPAGSGLGISMISTTVTGIDDIIDDDAEDILIDAVIGASAVGTQQTVTIDDDDAAPVLEISVSAASVAENGGTSTVTVTTGTGSTFVTEQAITLSLSGTATVASDYSVDTTLTLPAGVGSSASSVEATLTGVDDRIDDDAETVLIDAAREGSGFGTRQTVTIDDDDAAPVLVFTAQPANIGENGGVSTLTVGTGTGSTYATEQSITLAVVEGTAIEGADYTIASRSLTLPAGVGSSASSADTTVTGLDDGVFEGDEDQTVLVSATHAGAPVGTAQVAVVDDEANSQVVLTLTPDSIAESDNRDTSGRDQISQITASVSPPAEHAFVVDLEITPNAPATTADFTEALPVPSLGLLDFAAGATQSTGLAFINAVDNEVDTPDKTLTVSGSISGFDYDGFTVEPAATTGILAPAPRTLTIRDDDQATDTVSLSLDATSVAEDGGATPIEATATLASGARESAVTVTLNVGSGTGDAGAESGIDFEEVAAFTITIPAGSASATADFSLTPVDDRIDEADEVLSVTGATDEVLIGVPEAAEMTITDNDDAPELTLEVQPATIAENGGTATVTVSTGTGSTFADEQTITLSVAGTATTGTDYTISSQTLTLPAGAGAEASSATATVTAVDDNVDDDAETVVIGALLEGVAFGAEQTVTIADDEGSPQVTLVLTPPSIAEDGGVSTVTATVSPVSATAFTVAVASAPVSPAGAGDFGQSGTTLSFAEGAAASTGSVTISAVDNTADTPNLQVSVSGTVSSSGVSAPAVATLTILDDDTPAVLTLEVDATTIAEDGGAVTVTVTTGTGSTFDTDQAITLVLGGTATQGADYTVSATDLTLPAGSSSVTATVTGLDDGLFEDGETVLISGLHDGAAFGAEQTVTIADDEAAPVLTLVLTPDSIIEDGGTSTVTATLSSALTEPFTVTVAVEPDAPALPQDYELSGDTLSFAAEATISTGEVTITAVNNDVDQVDKTLQISGAVSLEAVAAPAGVTLTIEDDDEASSTVILTMTPERIDEGAAATEIEVTGALDSGARDADTVLTLLVGGGAATALPGVDYEPVADFNLTIPANETSATATFMLAPLEDRIDEADETVIVTGISITVGVGVPETVEITLADNDDAPVLALDVDPARIAENGGTATVTVTTGEGSTFAEERSITLALAGTATRGEDYRLDSTTVQLPAGIGTQASAATVTVTGLNDVVAEADETILIGGAVDGVAFGTQQTVTIEDDEGAPQVTLVLTPALIGENGGEGRVTATASPASAEAFTVTVSAVAVDPAVAGDFTLAGATLSFAADATASTGEVTITAVDNDVDAPDKMVTVSGSVSQDGVTAPADVSLTIVDDDEPETPVVTLLLTPASIGENGGEGRVTATASPASAEAFTVTVSAVAVDPAVAGDFTLAGATLSFAADATMSTGEVTITAVDNDVDAPDKMVTVSGSVSLDGVTAPADVSLTIVDDDEPETPVVTLLLTPALIGENGGEGRVTATASPASAEAFTVTVSAVAVDPAVAGDFTLAGATLSFAADATASTGEVTITAVDNDVDAPDKMVTVSGSVSQDGVTAPADVSLTIVDDDEPETPVVTLLLTPASIGENGGEGRVTATASPASAEAFTVTVSAVAVDPAVAGDFTLAGATLSFAVDATMSTGEVTITAVDNDVDAPDKMVTVSGSVSLDGVTAPADVSLTIVDDDEPETPVVTLLLTPASIGENGGEGRVTATASPASAEAFTVTVSAVAVDPAVAGDFTLAGATLSFAADATASTGEVTITAVDNDVDAPDKMVTVSGSVSLDGVTAPADVSLTIVDDDEPETPVVTLLLTPALIGENGGEGRVTATASPASAEAFTVTVSAVAVDPAVAGDFTLAGATLSFAADATMSTGEVTITAVDNDVDAPDKMVTVSGSVSLDGVTAPADVSLTIVDDDEPETPVVTLLLTPALIGENGGEGRVTATASPASAEAFTVTVSAVAVDPAVAGDFTLAGATLSFAADATMSTGEVTITAVDNDVDAPDKMVTVSGSVSLDGVTAPADVSLTIVDDDEPETPVVTLLLTPALIGENGGEGRVTATASPASAEAFTVTVSAVAVDPAVAGDFTLAGATLSFAADATMSTGEVTITAVDNDVDAPDKMVTVSGSVSLDGVTAPADVSLTIVDDEPETPVVTLLLTPALIGENGGEGRVTATASPASAEAFTVTVSAVAVDPAVAGDFTLAGATLSFAADATMSTGEVTITAVDNDVDAPDKMVTVSGSVSQDGVTAPADVSLTILDDDEPETPVVTLLLTPALIGENGGEGRVTATASPASAEAFTVTVSAVAVDPAVAGDFTLAGATLSFAADATMSTGEVTITAVDNDVDAPDKMVTVSGSVSLDGVTAPADVSLTIVDDDEPETPVVTLLLTPALIGENGGEGRVTATASPASAEAFTVTVSAVAVDPAVAGDFTLAGATLSFAADATMSSGEVTITAVDNDVDAPDKMVTVSGSVSLDGVTAPADVSLTILDDDEPETPVVTLLLTPALIGENGGEGRVTATASPASAEAFTVTVSAVAVDPAVAGDFTLAGATLSFAADATMSTGEVTITAVDNDVDAPDKMVTVSGSVSLDGVTAPADVSLTIVDDEPETPVVTLLLTPALIGENGGEGRVTATASPASAEAFTVTVSAVAVDPAVAGDFTLAGATLSFAADATMSTGEVTITAVDNDVDAPDKMVTVSGSVSQDGVTAPADVSLTIVDDDEPETPVVTLLLTPALIGENGGEGRVTATASPASAEAFTVTVSAVAVDPAVAGDFTLAGATLSFAADATMSTGEVTITAVDNDVDAPDKMVTVSGSVSLDGVTAPADVSLTIADDDEAPVERGVDISPTALTIDEGDATGGGYTLKLIAEPSEAVIVSVSAPSDVGLTVAPAQLTFTTANWSTAQTVTVTAAEDDDADDRRVTLTHSASGAGYENVAIDAVTVTILDQIDPEQPSVSIADARGAEADGELVFELTLSRAAGEAVSVRYETRDGTARAGEDYEAGTGTATVVAGEAGARIVVPLRIDLFREADETFEVILTSADGAWLDDASATGTIEDAAEDVGAPEKLLARFGRIAGGHVMTAIGDQISVDRLGGTGVTLAGTALTGDGASGVGLFGGGSFTAGAATLDQFGQGGFGLAAAGGDSSLPVAGGNWLAQPGKSPFGGNGLAMGGRFGDAGGDRFGRAGTGRMGLRELLANSAFLLNGGQDGGFSLWGRGNYTRFDDFGEGIQSAGDAVSATLGVDWSCARCRFGIALSRTVVEASYGESGREDGEIESTITGLYPYLSLRISDRFSVWGLAGQGQGELSARSAGDAPAQNAQKVDLRSRLAGLGARGEFLTTGNGFSLAVKTDAMYSRTSTEEAEGLLEAEGEYRRVRLGLEGAWLRPIGKEASLRSSFEVAAREDAGDAENGLGVEVAGGLEFSDLAPGLSLDVSVRGLVSHESEDYEEWGVSGGFRYDPRPGSVAGPLVSLSHSSGPADGGGLRQALWHDRMSRGQAASFESRRDMLSAEFAYGFKAFGALGVPWARIGTTGMGRDYRLGYSLLTRRGIPSLEFGQSAFERELRLGWEFSLRCRVQMAAQLLHTTDSLGEREDTGIVLRFRSIVRRGTSGTGTCGTLQPLFTSGAPR